jgi:hypothetical protein
MLPLRLVIDMSAWPFASEACQPSWRPCGGLVLTRLLCRTECEQLLPVALSSVQVSAFAARSHRARSGAVTGGTVRFRFIHRGRNGPTESMGIPPWNH